MPVTRLVNVETCSCCKLSTLLTIEEQTSTVGIFLLPATASARISPDIAEGFPVASNYRPDSFIMSPLVDK